MLPGESGLALLKKLKADPDTKEIPVILLTALGGEYDKVIGLDLGADDYISKPFSVMELLARIRAVKRRSNSTIIQHLEYNGIEINYLNRTARVDGGEELDLTFKEFELLFQLFFLILAWPIRAKNCWKAFGGAMTLKVAHALWMCMLLHCARNWAQRAL